MLGELQLVRLLFSVASLSLLFSAHFPRSQRVFRIVVARSDLKTFAIHTSYHWRPSSKWMVSRGILAAEDRSSPDGALGWEAATWQFTGFSDEKNSTLVPTFFLSGWQEKPNRRSCQFANFCFLSQTGELSPRAKTHINILRTFSLLETAALEQTCGFTRMSTDFPLDKLAGPLGCESFWDLPKV